MEKKAIPFADSKMIVAIQDGDDHIATGIFLSNVSYS